MRLRVLDVPVDLVRREEAMALLASYLRHRGRLLHVVTVNPECIAIARRSPAYRRIVSSAGLALVDGVGVEMVARLRGARTTERFPGADLVWELARLCQESGARLFFLGSRPEVAAAAVDRLRERYPGLQVDWHSPPHSPALRLPAAEDAAILACLRRFAPHVLCVALGMPKQEVWIAEHREELEMLGVRVAVGVGGALDYLAGALPRPPRALRQAGLEWLYRLLRQPRRRWRRQLSRLPYFLVLALAEALRERLGQSSRPPSHRPRQRRE
jgi:N-acetylglucosaminyldiphosphoundecaprenol N-acetyl-beta-D-mannosaminyltransferase